jgi:hypothetical protein
MIARHELACQAFAAILDGPDWYEVESWGAWSSARTARLAFLRSGTESGAMLCYLRISLPHYYSTPQLCRVSVNGDEVAEYQISSTPRSIMVPLGEASSITVHIALDEVTPAPQGKDQRLLGIGLHDVYCCLADDLAGRLAHMERIVFGRDVTQLDPSLTR